jgi:hypothetical protein
MSILARLLTGLLLISAAGIANAEPLDPAKPQDSVTMMRKLQCSIVDGKPVRFWWQGRVYSRAPGTECQAVRHRKRPQARLRLSPRVP